jgi:hypothetical protein
MPGYLLHLNALVLCVHSGQARPPRTNPRVKLSGNPVVTQPTLYQVTGCSLPPNSGGPCVTGQWISAAARVKAGGEPVLLDDSQAICTPTGTGLLVRKTQQRVKGL